VAAVIAATPLAGKLAVVTGANRGIGRAIALELAGAGAGVVVHYNSAEAGAPSAVAEIQRLGRCALPFDLSDRQAVRALLPG